MLDEPRASDAVQSAYLAAFQHLDGFRGDAEFHTWITRIVKNQCFMYFRQPERRRVISNVGERPISDALYAVPNGAPSPEDVLQQHELNTAH